MGRRIHRPVRLLSQHHDRSLSLKLNLNLNLSLSLSMKVNFSHNLSLNLGPVLRLDLSNDLDPDLGADLSPDLSNDLGHDLHQHKSDGVLQLARLRSHLVKASEARKYASVAHRDDVKRTFPAKVGAACYRHGPPGASGEIARAAHLAAGAFSLRQMMM